MPRRRRRRRAGRRSRCGRATRPRRRRGRTRRAIQSASPASTRSRTSADSSGAMIVTRAPSARNRSSRRAVTAPPPTMTTARPASETPSIVVTLGPPNGAPPQPPFAGALPPHEHIAVAHRHRPDVKRLRLLALRVEARAGPQIEDLLVHRGCDGRSILSGADDAARDDVRTAVRVEVRYRMHPPPNGGGRARSGCRRAAPRVPARLPGRSTAHTRTQPVGAVSAIVGSTSVIGAPPGWFRR